MPTAAPPAPGSVQASGRARGGFNSGRVSGVKLCCAPAQLGLLLPAPSGRGAGTKSVNSTRPFPFPVQLLVFLLELEPKFSAAPMAPLCAALLARLLLGQLSLVPAWLSGEYGAAPRRGPRTGVPLPGPARWLLPLGGPGRVTRPPQQIAATCTPAETIPVRGLSSSEHLWARVERPPGARWCPDVPAACSGAPRPFPPALGRGARPRGRARRCGCARSRALCFGAPGEPVWKGSRRLRAGGSKGREPGSWCTSFAALESFSCLEFPRLPLQLWRLAPMALWEGISPLARFEAGFHHSRLVLLSPPHPALFLS